MTKQHPNPLVAKFLRKRASTERHYYVPGTSHGYTLDLEQAKKWAQHRAKFAPEETVAVLAQDVELGKFEVIAEYGTAEMERYPTPAAGSG